MPSPKRASMREGPLAALFRKTADDSGAPEQEAPPAPAAEERSGRQTPRREPLPTPPGRE